MSKMKVGAGRQEFTEDWSHVVLLSNVGNIVPSGNDPIVVALTYTV